jgi:hypothetical protein
VIENEKEATTEADASYDSVIYCSVCEKELERNTIVLEGTKLPSGPQTDETLNFMTNSLNLQAYIGAEFVVKMTGRAEPDRIYIAYTLNGENIELDEYVVSKTSKNTYYSFIIKTAAKQMGDVLNITLYEVRDGVTYQGQTIENWTVAGKLYEMIESSSDKPKAQTLAVDLLNYGAAAQAAFSYNAENPVNAALTEAQKAMGTQEAPAITDNTVVVTNPNATVTLRQKSLNAESIVTLEPVFKFATGTDLTQYTAVVTPEGAEEYTVNMADMFGSKTLRSVPYDKFAAKEMNKTITITIYKGDVAVSDTFTFCIMDAAAGMYGGTYDALAKAVAIYGNSAKAYFG